MTSLEQSAVFYLLVLGMFLAFAIASDRAIMGPIVGARNYWRRRGPVIFGFWLPTVAILYLTVTAYALIRASSTGWAAAAIVVGTGCWATFLWLRGRIMRRRHGTGPLGLRERCRLVRDGVRLMPRGRLIVYAAICLWAIAGIVGSLITFLR